MSESHHNAHKDNSTLPDELARERTQFAKERTLLAYIRTALAFLTVGAGFMGFFEAVEAHLTAWIFFAAGIGFFLFGLVRFLMSMGRRNS